MRFRHAAALLGLVVPLGIAGCGGSPRAGSGGAAERAPAAPLPAHAPGAGAGANAGTAEERRRDFLSRCAKQAVQSPEYCECAWKELHASLGDDLASGGEAPSPARLDKVRTQVLTACGNKLPEAPVREQFVTTCIGDKPAVKPYCDCMWLELRKRFSTAELNDEPTVASERFSTARVPVVKACGSRMPESVSREAFMRGCVKDPSVDAFCGCVWTELRKQATPAQIESGTFDQKILFSQVERACGKLRPAK